MAATLPGSAQLRFDLNQGWIAPRRGTAVWEYMIAIRPLSPDCAVKRQAGQCTTCSAREFSVCGALGDADLYKMNALAEHVTLKAGETLTREGDPARHLFNITAGSVRVFKLLPDGRRQIMGFLFAGDLLGLTAGDEFAFSAEAVEDMTACRFKRPAYRALVKDSPALEAALLERANHELAAAHNQMVLLGRKTAQERLATFLLDLPSKDPARFDGPNHVRLPMSRSEIADYLGLTIETVSRVLTKLKTQGLIQLTSLNDVTIVHPAALRRIAEGDA